MRKRLRHAIVALIVVVLASGALLLGRTIWEQKRKDLGRQVLDVLPQVAQRIRDFHRKRVVDGKPVWEVSASEARYFDEEEMAVVSGPSVAFYDSRGREVALKGREGKVYLADRELNKVELRGDIEVRFGSYSARTDRARYERGRNAIVAPGRVEVNGAEFDLQGDGLEIELSTQRLRLNGNVRMTLRPGT